MKFVEIQSAEGEGKENVFSNSTEDDDLIVSFADYFKHFL